MGPLHRRQGDRDIVQLEVPPVEVEAAGRHRLEDDVGGLLVAFLCNSRVQAEEAELDRGRTSPYAEIVPAAAQLVEHADILERAVPGIEVQQHDQRVQPQVLVRWAIVESSRLGAGASPWGVPWCSATW